MMAELAFHVFWLIPVAILWIALSALAYGVLSEALKLLGPWGRGHADRLSAARKEGAAGFPMAAMPWGWSWAGLVRAEDWASWTLGGFAPERSALETLAGALLKNPELSPFARAAGWNPIVLAQARLREGEGHWDHLLVFAADDWTAKAGWAARAHLMVGGEETARSLAVSEGGKEMRELVVPRMDRARAAQLEARELLGSSMAVAKGPHRAKSL